VRGLQVHGDSLLPAELIDEPLQGLGRVGKMGLAPTFGARN